MSENPVEIGLPSISEEGLEALIERCEDEVTSYLLKKVPQKSIEELSVICVIELSEQLDVDITIEISQKYSTSDNLDALVGEAIAFGTDWLETQLREMSSRES